MARRWPGICDDGGIGRVVKVHMTAGMVDEVDVRYIVSRRVAKQVSIEHVEPHADLDRSSRRRQPPADNNQTAPARTAPRRARQRARRVVTPTTVSPADQTNHDAQDTPPPRRLVREGNEGDAQSAVPNQQQQPPAREMTTLVARRPLPAQHENRDHVVTNHRPASTRPSSDRTNKEITQKKASGNKNSKRPHRAISLSPQQEPPTNNKSRRRHADQSRREPQDSPPRHINRKHQQKDGKLPAVRKKPSNHDKDKKLPARKSQKHNKKCKDPFKRKDPDTSNLASSFARAAALRTPIRTATAAKAKVHSSKFLIHNGGGGGGRTTLYSGRVSSPPIKFLRPNSSSNDLMSPLSDDTPPPFLRFAQKQWNKKSITANITSPISISSSPLGTPENQRDLQEQKVHGCSRRKLDFGDKGDTQENEVEEMDDSSVVFVKVAKAPGVAQKAANKDKEKGSGKTSRKAFDSARGNSSPRRNILAKDDDKTEKHNKIQKTKAPHTEGSLNKPAAVKQAPNQRLVALVTQNSITSHHKKDSPDTDKQIESQTKTSQTQASLSKPKATERAPSQNVKQDARVAQNNMASNQNENIIEEITSSSKTESLKKTGCNDSLSKSTPMKQASNQIAQSIMASNRHVNSEANASSSRKENNEETESKGSLSKPTAVEQSPDQNVKQDALVVQSIMVSDQHESVGKNNSSTRKEDSEESEDDDSSDDASWDKDLAQHVWNLLNSGDSIPVEEVVTCPFVTSRNIDRPRVQQCVQRMHDDGKIFLCNGMLYTF